MNIDALNKMLKSLKNFFGGEGAELPPNPIFVVGCYNSGTTLLAELISRNDKVACFPTEGASLTKAITTPEDFGWNRLWVMSEPQMRIVEAGKSIDMEAVKKDWSVALDYSKSHTHFVEKSIINTRHISHLIDAFPTAKFIWIIRNPYNVVEGIRRRTKDKKRKFYDPGVPYPLHLCAFQWLETNLRLASTLPKESVLRVTYEALVADPTAIMGCVFRFCGLDQVDEKALLSDFTFQGSVRPISDNSKESLAGLTDEEVELIRQITLGGMKMLGYAE